MRAVSQEIPQPLNNKISLKITHLKFTLNLPGISELTHCSFPSRCGTNFECIVFKLIIQNSSWGPCCEIALIWMPENSTNGESILVQVMAWCRQAPSHYLCQCWPRSMSPYVMSLGHNKLILRIPLIIPSASMKLKGGYTGFTLSVCPSVDRIVSNLYLQQYSLDPFHICSSYQSTSERVPV